MALVHWIHLKENVNYNEHRIYILKYYWYNLEKKKLFEW